MGDAIDLRDIADAEVKRGTRLIALALLQDADSAFAGLNQRSDDEALHDFRVALRRLRSHVRSYRDWLRESVGRKQERRLRRIARASNANRDAEILLEGLDALSLEESAGAAHLAQQWRARLHREQDGFQAQANAAFPALARRLRRGLSTYTADLFLDRTSSRPLATVASEVAARLRAELHSALLAVRSVEHQQEAHEARIAGKKLRYLLEPFADMHAQSAAAVVMLKQLQDVLGDLHDADVLLLEVEAALQAEPADPSKSDLAVVLDAAHRHRSSIFERVQRDYLSAQAAALHDTVGGALRELAEHTLPRRERVFLLKRLPRLRGALRQTIQQGYLPGTDITERVQSVESGAGLEYTRSVWANGNARVDEATRDRVFKRLYALTKGRRVRKQRYTVEDSGLSWSIDRFMDRKLVLARVDWLPQGEPLVLPAWLKRHMVREVTGETEFRTENLAR